eukprot:gene22512-27167_t
MAPGTVGQVRNKGFISRATGFNTAMKACVYVVVFAATFSLVAATPKFGPCPKVVTGMTELDLNKMGGFWFEWGQYNAFFERGDCVVTNYTLELDQNRIECLDRSYTAGKGFSNNPSDPKRVLEWLTCKPNADGTWNPACQMVVSQGGVAYTVLETDYTSYSIGYSCADVKLGHLPLLWVVTRDNVPSDSFIEMLKTKIDTWPELDVKYEDLDLQTTHYDRAKCCSLYTNKTLINLPAELLEQQCGAKKIAVA